MDFLPEGVNFNRDITYLAKTNFRKEAQIFGIKRRDRRQHMYVLGKSGTGKSVLLSNLIVQNIFNGEGVCVVDPHGELVESIIATIPPHRVKDVIYFNPADTDYHIGFNVLEVDDPRYKHLVASGLMGIFTKIWANVWSSRMEYIMNNAILALIDTPGSTLLGIPRLLVDKDYRQVVVGNLKDPVIKAFWIHEYESWREQFRNEAIAPIQNKVGQFLSTSIVRNVVGQSKSTIDLFEIMNSGKIFIVNVSKGRIGEDNAALLGGMIITKLQLAAMERVRIPEEERKDFYLYVDEFQNFVTDSFASILSEARKYRLNLTLAHQYIAQLSTKDSDTVRDAVFGNVGTMIIFRVGAVDGEYLEKEFDPEFTTQDMVNLPNYKIYLKLMVDGITSRPFSASTLPPFQIPEGSNVQAEIIESSRRLYARPREDVEREIFEWSGMLASNGGGINGAPGEGKFKAVCSSCGKDTTVPFEPEEGRPVYCKDCIAKIKSGELQPVKGTRKEALKPQSQSFAVLAGLGIEFAPEANALHKPLYKKNLPPQNAPAVSGTPDRNAKVFSEKVPARVLEKPLVPNRPAIVAPMPKPQNTQTPNGHIPKPAFDAQRAPNRSPRERKGPDHEGLQNILKEALGEALKAGAEFKREITEGKKITKENLAEDTVEKVVEVKKTISLSELKKPESAPSSLTRIADKNASEGSVSALQEAINRAKNNIHAAPSVVIKTDEASTIEIKKEVPIPEIEKAPEAQIPPKQEIPERAPETPKEETPPKKVREVPEEVLRGLLE